MTYLANSNRYDSMVCRCCGQSGLKLPTITLGRWHNFGGINLWQRPSAQPGPPARA